MNVLEYKYWVHHAKSTWVQSTSEYSKICTRVHEYRVHEYIGPNPDIYILYAFMFSLTNISGTVCSKKRHFEYILKRASICHVYLWKPLQISSCLALFFLISSRWLVNSSPWSSRRLGLLVNSSPKWKSLFPMPMGINEQDWHKTGAIKAT